jgi:hypothetical protein
MTLARDLADRANDKSIVQIIAATYNTQVSTTSGSFIDTGLTATITPTSASNKILIIVHLTGILKDTNNTHIFAQLVRNSTGIGTFEGIAGYNNANTTSSPGGSGIVLLDVPATTSATTYKVQFKSNNSNANVYVQGNGCVSSICLMEVTP